MGHKHAWRKVYELPAGTVRECLGCGEVKGPPAGVEEYERMLGRRRAPPATIGAIATIRREEE